MVSGNEGEGEDFDEDEIDTLYWLYADLRTIRVILNYTYRIAAFNWRFGHLYCLTRRALHRQHRLAFATATTSTASGAAKTAGTTLGSAGRSRRLRRWCPSWHWRLPDHPFFATATLATCSSMAFAVFDRPCRSASNWSPCVVAFVHLPRQTCYRLGRLPCPFQGHHCRPKSPQPSTIATYSGSTPGSNSACCLGLLHCPYYQSDTVLCSSAGARQADSPAPSDTSYCWRRRRSWPGWAWLALWQSDITRSGQEVAGLT